MRALLFLLTLTSPALATTGATKPTNPVYVLKGDRHSTCAAAMAGSDVAVTAHVVSIRDDNAIASASSPVAQSVEWHKTVGPLDVKQASNAVQHIDLSGPQHLVLKNINRDLKSGMVFPVVLAFAHDAGATLLVRVQ